MPKVELQIEGYSIFIVKCKDGSYHTGMCRNLNKRLKEINSRMIARFVNRPDLVPVTLIFHEDHILFKEAYAKHRFLKYATRRYRDRLIRTGQWPLGKNLKEYIEKNS